MRNERVLVLNADYMAHQIISWRRAMVLYVMWLEDPTTGAEVIEYYGNRFIIDTRNKKHPVPAVIRLSQYVKRTKETVPFSRKNVFIRDNFTCQYCGNKHAWDQLTFDHVTPRAKWDIGKLGSPTVWTNIVTCCYGCNNKKADKTLKEVKMRLLREPKTPRGLNFVIGLSPWNEIPSEWCTYLPAYYTNNDKEKVN